MAGINECKRWVDEIDWDMIHEDAVTRHLEWGNNDPKDLLRKPVTLSDEYSIYFVVNTWNTDEPKVVLTKMNNYGSEALCEKLLPGDIAGRFMESIGSIRGIHEPNDEIKDWIKKLLENE